MQRHIMMLPLSPLHASNPPEITPSNPTSRRCGCDHDQAETTATCMARGTASTAHSYIAEALRPPIACSTATIALGGASMILLVCSVVVKDRSPICGSSRPGKAKNGSIGSMALLDGRLVDMNRWADGGRLESLERLSLVYDSGAADRSLS